MKELVAGIQYDAAKVIEQAIGPSKEFCMGYMNPGAPDGRGYISTMKLSVGTVDVKGLDAVTENIVSYDRCEKNDAYIGQINMLTVSSFCEQLWVWSAIGIAILKNRSDGSCLFIEDANTYGDDNTTEAEIIGFLEGSLRKVTNSIVLCGQNQSVEYDRIHYPGHEPEVPLSALSPRHPQPVPTRRRARSNYSRFGRQLCRT